MLTTILNQNEVINNYILELNLPYSSALKNQRVQFLALIFIALLKLQRLIN